MQRARLCLVLVMLASLGPSSVADASETPWLIPPVDGPIVRDYEEPLDRFGPGHRGIDIAAPDGAVVRAAGSGIVAFAGVAATMRAVTIDHGNGVETTYSDLATTSLVAGQRVTEGTIVGAVGRPHAGAPSGLHLGVRSNGRYVDPRLMLASIDVAGAIHLAPLMWEPPESLGGSFAAAFREAGTAFADCAEPPRLNGNEMPPPTDNIAVAVAGIGSASQGAAIYENGPEQLGYSDVYPFSYAGVDADDAHIPYGPQHTVDDINIAAGKLRALLVDVGRRHPGRHVDLFAHSQGGIVARTLLARAAAAGGVDVPAIDHLVTFASPHEGASLAGVAARMEESLIGRAILRVGARVARVMNLPDPSSEAVRQLAPGSDLMQTLASETVLFGTRVLTLAIPNDPVVPADSALLDGSISKVVGPRGLLGHEAIVGSPEALATAYQFLRGGPAPCRAGWDLWGPRIGRAVGWLEGRLDDLPGLIEGGFWSPTRRAPSVGGDGR